MSQPFYDHEEFIRAYMESYRAMETTADLGAKLGVQTKWIGQRKAQLKNWGIELPALQRPVRQGWSMLDFRNHVNRLKAIVEEEMKKDEPIR